MATEGLSLPAVSTLQDSVMKLKNVSNYKRCRASLVSGGCVILAVLRRESRGCQAQGVGSQVCTPLATWDEAFVALCCGSRQHR